MMPDLERKHARHTARWVGMSVRGIPRDSQGSAVWTQTPNDLH
jgi:hypothetical protein